MAFTVFQRDPEGAGPEERAASQRAPLERARGIQQSGLERAFSGIYSLPESGR